MDILKRIDQIKNEKGWSDYELSKRSGVPQGTISSWRRFGTAPTFPTLEQVCISFGITLAQFFEDEDNPSFYLSKEEREWLMKFRRLNDRQRVIILDLLENM